jgi:hypothetical protein
MENSPELVFSKYVELLEGISRSALPLAARGTLNDLAYVTRTDMTQKQMPSEFTLRNSFEQRSVQFQKSRNTFEINAMSSSAGQVDPFKFQTGQKDMDDLALQEGGGAETPREGKKYHRMPLDNARTGRKRSGRVQPKNRPTKGLKWMTLPELQSRLGVKNAPATQGMPIRQVWALLLYRKMPGVSNGDMFILPSKKKPGYLTVFRKMAREARPIHSLKPGNVRVKKKETLTPAVNTAIAQSGRIWAKNVDRRLEYEVNKRVKKFFS